METKTVKSLIYLVGKFGNIAKQHGDTMMANACTGCLFAIAALIIPQKFVSITEGHEEELSNIISWLAALQDSQSNVILRDVENKIARVILYCYKCDYANVAELGIKTVSQMAQNVLRNDSSGYAALQILGSLDIIGCYGIASEQEQISIKVANEYLDFEEKYEERFATRPHAPSPQYNRRFFREYDVMYYGDKSQEKIEQIMTAEHRQGFEAIKKSQLESRRSGMGSQRA